MIHIKYEITNLDDGISKLERDFNKERDYIIWKRAMTKGSKLKGKHFKIIRVEGLE